MDKNNFYNEMKIQAEQINIKFNEKQIDNFYTYMQLLLQWNEKINLTAITDEKEVITKHFIDSMTIKKYINLDDKVIDVGTGAGFPGIPLKIIEPNIEVTLLDSLNKRIKFLDILTKALELKSIVALHSRVEDFAKEEKYREKFDIATSRAVAQLNILLEYLLPLVKVGGKCICMKGSNIEEEIYNSKNSLKILGGEIEIIDNMLLPNTDITRNIIVIKKITETPKIYPRNSGIPNKNPL